ncbi:MAG: hypothetical protein PHC29_08520 [Candidatus Omnitrophica bacterium]|nr:hypothetical protein [Candidatus Omnitrophota bacterium]
MSNFKYFIKFKKGSPLLFLGIIIIAIGAAAATARAFLLDPIPTDYQLKASTNKIIESREIDWITGEPGSFINNGRIISYAYISDQLVGQANYFGIPEDMSKRTGNTQFFPKNKDEKGEIWIAKIYSGTPLYYVPQENKWHEVKIATTTIDAFNRQTSGNFFNKLLGKNVFADSIAPYAGDGDGYVTYDVNGSSWDTARDPVAGNSAGPAQAYTYVASGNDGTYNWIYRSFFPFDTSSIPSGSQISSADLFLYLSNNRIDTDNDSNGYMAVVETFQADYTTLSNTDYCDNGYGNDGEIGCQSTSTDIVIGGSVDTTDLTASSYNDWPLNSNGLSWIKVYGESSTCGSSLTGWTCLGVREGHDIVDDPVDSNTRGSIEIAASETSGTSHDPYLVVEYVVVDTTITKVYKSNDQSVMNSSAVQPDSELILNFTTSTANKTYMIEGVIFASSTSATPDIKIAFDTDVSSWVPKIGFMGAHGGTFGLAEMLEGDRKESSRIPITANTVTVIQVSGTIKMDGTAGKLKLYWAQATSNGTPTTVRAGSYLKAEAIE